MLTSLFGSAEILNIYCAVEVFDDLRQLPVYFLDRFQPAHRPRCDHQRLPIPEHDHLPCLT